MFCIYCGKKIHDRSRYCIYCGKTLPRELSGGSSGPAASPSAARSSGENTGKEVLFLSRVQTCP